MDVDEVEFFQDAVQDVFLADDAADAVLVVDHREAAELVIFELVDHRGQGFAVADGDDLLGHDVADGVVDAVEFQGVDDVLDADDADQLLLLVDHRDARDLLDLHQLLGVGDLLVGGDLHHVGSHDVAGLDVLEDGGVPGELSLFRHRRPAGPGRRSCRRRSTGNPGCAAAGSCSRGRGRWFRGRCSCRAPRSGPAGR